MHSKNVASTIAKKFVAQSRKSMDELVILMEDTYAC